MTSSISPSSPPFKSSFNILNPTTLFVAFSLGIHALVLWLVFPRIDPNSLAKPTNSAESVPLIELSAAEQALLPDLSSESFDLDDFNLPVGNIPDTASSPLEIDPLALQSALPNLPPPPPSLPPLSYGSNIPITITPPSLPSARPRRAYRPRPIPRNYNRFSTRLPAPPPNLPLPPSNSLTTRPDLPQQSNRPNFDPIRQAIDPDDLINGRFNSSASGNSQDNLPDIAANTPSNQRTPRPLSPREQTARQLQEERMRRLVAETQQNAEGLRYDGTNTTNEEAMRNDLALRTEQGVAEPKYRTLTGNYPKAACSRQLEGTAVYGVFVSPQGTIQPPQQIRSTGYGVLNQQALQQIGATSFANASGSQQYYQVTVNFSYDSNLCDSRATTPKQPAQSTTQPAPIPVKPAPSVSPEPTQQTPTQQNQPSPRPAQENQSPAPIITEEAPSPTPKPESPNNEATIEASPQPRQENDSPAPATLEKPAVKPSPTQETQQNSVDTAPQPRPENQPPAPPTTRKTPTQQVQPSPATQQPRPENQPPAPPTSRKTPTQPTENQPPAPSAVRKPSEAQSNSESVE